MDWIDVSRLDALRDEIGDEDFGEVISLFLSETEAVLATLGTHDLPQLAADLHFLKGSALNMGFAAFGALCQAGERSAASGRGDAIDPDGIRAAYAASKAALAQVVGRGLV